MDLGYNHLAGHQKRMGGFLLMAVILHGSFFTCMQMGGFDIQPKLPDWVNIKLVAGIDNPTRKEEMYRIPKVQPKQAKVAQSNDIKESQDKSDVIEPVSETQAQDFVKADSRPFEHKNPKPFYPAVARRRGMQGLVLLEVEVNIRGKVSNVILKKSSGYGLLDNAAMSTVQQWQFTPAQKGNRVVTSIVEIPVRFEFE